MVSGDKYNALQIIRPVHETPALNRYLAAAELAGRVIFGNGDFDVNSDAILADLMEDMSEIDDEQMMRTYNIGAAQHDIYSRRGLKLLLLDRRAPAPIKAQPLFRAFMRFKGQRPEPVRRGKAPVKNQKPGMPYDELRQAALRHDIPDPSRLTVNFDTIVPVVDPLNTNLGMELALLPKREQTEALLIYDEAEICAAAFGSLYPNLAYPATKTTGQVSFSRMPANASDDQQLKYIGFLERNLGTGLNLQLGGVEAKLPN